MFSRYDPLSIVSLILQATVIVFLLQGAFQKYPMVLTYSITRLCTTVMESFILHKYGVRSAHYRNLYYTDRVVLNLVLLLMVTAIVYHVLARRPERLVIGRVIAGIVLPLLFGPFLVLSNPFTISWLNGMCLFLYFGSGIMTLILWRVVFSSDSYRDWQLMKFIVGLGISMSGAAVSFGLDQWMRSPQTVWMPNFLLQVTHVAGLLAWCWAFQPTAPKSEFRRLFGGPAPD